MESTSPPSLLYDQGRYVSSYKTFCAHETFKYTEWVDDTFGEAVVSKLQARQDELRVLGVGSGFGDADYSMLRKLLRRFPRISNRVVEPLHGHIIQYQELAQSKAHELRGVSCDWRQQTIEQYEKAGDLTKFHFISAIHSLYYVPDLDSSLTFLYDRLEPGGILLVTMVSDKSGWKPLWQRVQDFNSQPHLNSADIRSFSESRGIPYSQYHHSSRVNITEFFDGTSEEVRLLLDFFTHIVNFKETASEDLQKSVMESLASSECSEKNGDEVWFNDDWNTVIIKKPL